MAEARSLTRLSESDYEAIAAAVMETARGRWFMAEFAMRNRQADTAQLLGAIGRIERVVGLGPAQPAPDVNMREAAALIADLRLDLERISGRGGEPSSGLAARIESAAGDIVLATEGVQEASWSLREAGADEAYCDALDKRASRIHAATAIIDSTSQQIAKIADTIAMLDSSLRAFCESAGEALPAAAAAPVRLYEVSAAAPLVNYSDIDVVEIAPTPQSLRAEPLRAVAARPLTELWRQGTDLAEDDVVFSETEVTPDPLLQPHVMAAAAISTSEAELREIDALPAQDKLAYFA